jgi:hypothetical protein
MREMDQLRFSLRNRDSGESEGSARNLSNPEICLTAVDETALTRLRRQIAQNPALNPKKKHPYA